jgi:GT2 family glycosyltransferase
VSVVVASYNHAVYLDRRMQGLLDQTYPHLEILAIDDCSPDGSVDVLRRYESDPRVRLVVRETNGGWVAVSNQGLELATGEYVIFANCDDDCEPRMIERLVDSLERHRDAGVAFCRSVKIDSRDRVTGDDFSVRSRSFRTRCAADTFIPRKEMRRFLLHSCVIPNLSAALMRVACVDRCGGFTKAYRACSDWDLFLRIADDFDFAYVCEALNRFRQHEATVRSATAGQVTLDEFLRVLLGEVARGSLDAGDRTRGRYRAMYLWAMDLVRPTVAGVAAFRHHLARVSEIDPTALCWLGPAIAHRAAEVAVKSAGRAAGMFGGSRTARE